MTAPSAEDVADILEGVKVTYAAPGSSRVVVVDGFGVRVGVERGALEVSDGIGEDRRTRRFEVVAPPERVVVTGEGTFTTQGLAWCHSQGTAVVVISRGDVLLAASPQGATTLVCDGHKHLLSGHRPGW
jgi:hypothetical protein